MRGTLKSAITYSWRNGIPALRQHSLLLVGTIVPFLVFFGPSILSGKFLVAGDPFYQLYPMRSFAWSELARGQAPVWTPHIFSGYPLLAMAQNALGYPLTWFYLVLPGRWAEQILILAPFLLTPIFTYAYAREVGRSVIAALLAGLAFTYAGNISSKLGGLSPAANSEMWLPLLLLTIERSRRRPLLQSLLLAAGIYAMAVLAGHAQGYLLVATLALVYSVFVSAVTPIGNKTTGRLSRCRPLLVAIGGIALGAGVGAFQIAETLVALRNSVRGQIGYEVFTAGAFSPRDALYSFLAPPYHYIEVSTYVAPLAVIFAVIALIRIGSAASDRSRILFWLAVAIAAFLLMLGDHTPLYRILYNVPVFNWFRYPSRHALEWSFSLSVLSAYGFDAIVNLRRKSKPNLLAVNVLAGLCALVAVLWWRATFSGTPVSNFGLDSGLIPTLSERSYLLWKLMFGVIVIAAFWIAFSIWRERARPSFILITLLLAVCVEANLFLSHVWFPFAKASTQFTETQPVDRWLQQQSPELKRIYTRTNLFVRGYYSPPRVSLPNLTAIHGLQNVAGYEQLILDRYSRALGNAGSDGVNLRYGVDGPPDQSLLTSGSHVLDLLNTHYVVGFNGFATAPEESVEKDGVRFSTTEMGTNLLPGHTFKLNADAASGDTLALVSSLSASVDLPQGATVATINIATTSGQTIKLDLQAGRDTAEWAHERPDVKSQIKHQLASIYDEPQTDDKTFKALRFWSRLRLPERLQVERIEVTNVTQQAQLAIWKATLYDSQSSQSATLHKSPEGQSDNRMIPVFREGDVVVWQNRRAMPRAWLVTNAEAVDDEEALRRIRSSDSFDPGRTALLETSASELPRLTGETLPPESSCRVIQYESASLAIETNAPVPSVLVVSEIFYPGWEARIDGTSTPILRANYLLRGIVVPAGKHRIEMWYAAPAAKRGAIVSLVTLLILLGLSILCSTNFSLSSPKVR